MKSSRKELNLFLLMVIILVAAAYYFLFYSKHSKDIEELERKHDSVKEQYDINQIKIETGAALQKQIEEKTKRVEKIAKRNFGILKQEEQIVLLNKLKQDINLEFKNMQFSEQEMTLSALKSTIQAKASEQLGYLKRTISPEELEKIKEKNNLQGLDSDETNTNTQDDKDNKSDYKSKKDEKSTEKTGTGIDSNKTDELISEREENSFLDESIVDVITVTIKFEGEYEELEKYLKKVFSYQKEIIVEKINFSETDKKDEEKLKEKQGELVLAFYGYRDLDSHIKNKTKTKWKAKTNRGKDENAYEPYKEYVQILINEVSTVDAPPVEDIPAEEVKPEIHIPTPEELFREGKARNPAAKSLDSFENFDVFFVGDNRNISGSVKPTNKATHGQRAVRFTYQFHNPEYLNRANLVFDKKKILLYSKAESIGLSIFSQKPLGENRIGVCIGDTIGNESFIYFDAKSTDKGWIYTNATLPNDIVYPCMVKRVFVEGKGLNQATSGTLIFDDLRFTDDSKDSEDDVVDEETKK